MRRARKPPDLGSECAAWRKSLERSVTWSKVNVPLRRCRRLHAHRALCAYGMDRNISSANKGHRQPVFRFWNAAKNEVHVIRMTHTRTTPPRPLRTQPLPCLDLSLRLTASRPQRLPNMRRATVNVRVTASPFCEGLSSNFGFGIQ